MGRRYRDPYLEPILTLPEGWDPQDLHQEFPGAVENWCTPMGGTGTLSVESGILYLEPDIPSSSWVWTGKKWIIED